MKHKAHISFKKKRLTKKILMASTYTLYNMHGS